MEIEAELGKAIAVLEKQERAELSYSFERGILVIMKAQKYIITELKEMERRIRFGERR